MFIIGIDPHKGSHTAVAIGSDEEPLGKLRILQLWMTLPSGLRWAPPRFAH